MGTEKSRRANIHELYRLICNIKNGKGDYDPEIFELKVSKFCFEKGIRRRTVDDYIKTLTSSGLLKL